ncbi:MAG: hypothetical protein WEE36_09165 [Acidimicrobiia bacterium]
MQRFKCCLGFVLLLGSIGACSSTEAVPFELTVSPEFVHGLVPGAPVIVVATITDEAATDQPAIITATAEGASVAVEPATIQSGEVAEIVINAEPTADDRPITIEVTATRGKELKSASWQTTVFAVEDDRGPYARELLALFTAWLADNEPDLGITPTTEFSGAMTSPELLVVSHYAFVSDEWELRLSWHIMVPPDDWSEITLRARDELLPTVAYRMASQRAALVGDLVIEQVDIQSPGAR